MSLHAMEQPPIFVALAYRVFDAKVRPEMTTNDEIQNVQRESKYGFLFCGNYILKYW
jgi:hypothetical protein